MASWKTVRMVLTDVDGVMTDGSIIVHDDGSETKRFQVWDGIGLRLLKAVGIRTGIITGRRSRAVRLRGRELGLDEVHVFARRKHLVLERILKKYRLRAEQICFIGDDVTDLRILRLVGFPVAVKNAVPEVKRLACYVTTKRGGQGAVREVAEKVLKAQGKWRKALESLP